MQTEYHGYLTTEFEAYYDYSREEYNELRIEDALYYELGERAWFSLIYEG